MEKYSSQVVSFILSSELEESLVEEYPDSFVGSFLRYFSENRRAITGADHARVGNKLELAMRWANKVMVKAQEVNYLFIKSLCALDVLKRERNSYTLFQYISWAKLFSFQLYVYREFAFKLVNVLFPEIYGYKEGTRGLKEKILLREKEGSVAETPPELEELFRHFESDGFRRVLGFRNEITHEETIYILERHERSKTDPEITAGKGFADNERVNVDKLSEDIQKARTILVESCTHLGGLYSRKLEDWIGGTRDNRGTQGLRP